MMIEEDLAVSEGNKIEQIFQREELEHVIEKLKDKNEDLNFISTQFKIQDLELLSWEQIIDMVLDIRQKSLLLDLIRELQQYILGMSSGTTDNSVLQSDELEELEYLIENKKIPLNQAVEVIVEFANRKLKLNIGAESLQQKLNSL